MRILHTADWHLADHLGRIDRTTIYKGLSSEWPTIAVRRKWMSSWSPAICSSELAGPDALREAITHFRRRSSSFCATAARS